MKVLNLYAGIGGNRKLWPNDIEVTAIEIDPKIAEIYKQHFPNDKVVVTDAHQYLLDHFKEFDFIWSSPPCPTHSRARNWGWPNKPVYPDMRLYQEILLLKHYFKGLWVVENVKPYYEQLIPSDTAGRHLFWSNFIITKIKGEKFPKDNLRAMRKILGIDVNERTLLRNAVNPKLGLHVWRCAFKIKQKTLLEKS